MTIPRCFADPSDWTDTEARLSRAEEHHLFHVLRARKGDRVVVFDGCGRTGSAEISGESGRKAVLRILEASETPRPEVSLALIQALPKGRQMDLIVEKAVEIGVSAIIPLISQRVVARYNRGQSGRRLGRWRKIVLSAARQSGSDWLPEVMPVSSFRNMSEIIGSLDRVLIGVLDPSAENIHVAVDRMRQEPLKKIGLMIGPEGDFSPEEINAAIDAGACPVTFGTAVLRVETAALYGLSILAYEFLCRPA
jgi:16S rRNA (uracil1498-N3)-methyltransferase